MAGFPYSNGRGRLSFRSWGIAKDGAETRDGWSNSASLNMAEVNQDHVCSDGRAISGVIDCPKNHKDGTLMNGFPNKGGNYQRGSHYVRDNPRAQESITNAQNAASDGGRTGFAGIFQRQKFEYGDMSKNGWNQPVHGRYESLADNVSTEPTLMTTGAWTRPTHAGWAMPPEVPLGKATNDTATAAEYPRESVWPSSGAMAGMDRQNLTLPNTYQPKKRDSVTTTIDSREAAKKYGGVFV